MQNGKMKIALYIVNICLSFLLLSWVFAEWFGAYKADLTSGREYSLSQESKEILRGLKGKVYFDIYLSDNLSAKQPEYAAYIKYVLALAQKYAVASGKVKINVHKASAYSAENAAAQKYGMYNLSQKADDEALYFGAVLSDDNGFESVIIEFNLDSQGHLEQSITQALYNLTAEQNRPVLGVVSPSVNLPQLPFYRQIKDSFAKITEVSSNTAEIPADVDVLLLIAPKYSDNLNFALDQFFMRGGRALILLDEVSETVRQADATDFRSVGKFNRLLAKFGIEYLSQYVLADKKYGQPLNNAGLENGQSKNVYWYVSQNIGKAALMKNISALSIYSGGALNLSAKPAVKQQVLAGSSDEAYLVSAMPFKQYPVLSLLTLPETANRQFPIAVLAEGNISSLYDKSILPQDGVFPFLQSSVKAPQIIVVADSDILTQTGFKNADDNFNFLQKSLDYLSGNEGKMALYFGQNTGNKSSVGEQIKLQIAQKFQMEKFQIEQKLQNLLQKFKLKMITMQRRNFGTALSSIREIESLQRQVSQETEALRQLRGKMAMAEKYAQNLIVILNIVIFPLVMLALLWLLCRWRKKEKTKQAERVLNDK